MPDAGSPPPTWISELLEDRAGEDRAQLSCAAAAKREHWERPRQEEDSMESWDIRSMEIEPHRPQVLRSDEETRAIAIRLPAGEQLSEHQVHERAYLLVADGMVEVSDNGSTVTGETGFLTHFSPNERHTVRALSESRLVLVLAPWPGVGHPSRAQ
jgi:quercetin dioxygenase-like cupin family protein